MKHFGDFIVTVPFDGVQYARTLPAEYQADSYLKLKVGQKGARLSKHDENGWILVRVGRKNGLFPLGNVEVIPEEPPKEKAPPRQRKTSIAEETALVPESPKRKATPKRGTTTPSNQYITTAAEDIATVSIEPPKEEHPAKRHRRKTGGAEGTSAASSADGIEIPEPSREKASAQRRRRTISVTQFASVVGNASSAKVSSEPPIEEHPAKRRCGVTRTSEDITAVSSDPPKEKAAHERSCGTAGDSTIRHADRTESVAEKTQDAAQVENLRKQLEDLGTALQIEREKVRTLEEREAQYVKQRKRISSKDIGSACKPVVEQCKSLEETVAALQVQVDRTLKREKEAKERLKKREVDTEMAYQLMLMWEDIEGSCAAQQNVAVAFKEMYQKESGKLAAGVTAEEKRKGDDEMLELIAATMSLTKEFMQSILATKDEDGSQESAELLEEEGESANAPNEDLPLHKNSAIVGDEEANEVLSPLDEDSSIVRREGGADVDEPFLPDNDVVIVDRDHGNLLSPTKASSTVPLLSVDNRRISQLTNEPDMVPGDLVDAKSKMFAAFSCQKELKTCSTKATPFVTPSSRPDFDLSVDLSLNVSQRIARGEVLISPMTQGKRQHNGILLFTDPDGTPHELFPRFVAPNEAGGF